MVTPRGYERKEREMRWSSIAHFQRGTDRGPRAGPSAAAPAGCAGDRVRGHALRQRGASSPRAGHLTVRRGPADAGGRWRKLLGDFALCVDATHPYAVASGEHPRRSAGRGDVTYRRLLRPAERNAARRRMRAERRGRVGRGGLRRAGQHAAGHRGQGDRGLRPAAPERLFTPACCRWHESLAACEAAGVPHRNIIAMQGPFSQELNEAHDPAVPTSRGS
jgi:hypothetical protein